jgi:hypothetical protein
MKPLTFSEPQAECNPEQFPQAGIGEARPVFTLYKLISFIYLASGVSSVHISYSTILYAFLTSPVSAICLTHLTLLHLIIAMLRPRGLSVITAGRALIQIPSTHFADVIEAHL